MAGYRFNTGRVSGWGIGAEVPAGFGYVANGTTLDTLISGRYYGNGNLTNAVLSFSGANTWAVPFCVGTTQLFDRIAVNVTTQSNAGGVARLGIYNMFNGYPTNLILDGGQIAIDSTGIKEVTISQILSPGWYGLVFSNSLMVSIRVSVNNIDIGRAAVNTTGAGAFFNQNNDYSSGFPASLSMTARNDANNGPFIALRAA